MHSQIRFLHTSETESPSKDGLEIFGLKKEETREESIEAFLKKHLFQWKERFGFLKEDEPRYKMLADIKARLMEHADIPEGDLVVIDSPEINAFVINTKSDVYFYTGLLRSLSEWCKKNNKKFTQDKIAFVMAHEMTHIEQGTFEETGETEDQKREKKHNYDALQERKNAEYDADRGGLILMAKGGFNPREGLEAMEFLQSLGEGIPLFSTHPRSADRLRELLDLVESPDTFLPSIDAEPTEITGELYETIHNEAEERPGTKLYRKEGVSQLESMMRKTENLHDALEIAALALEYDSLAVAFQERSKDYVKKEQAKRIVLENVGELIQGIISTYAKKGSGVHFSPSESGKPSEIIRYTDQEFTKPEEIFPPASSLAVENGGKIYQEKKMNQVTDSLRKRLDEVIQNLKTEKTKSEIKLAQITADPNRSSAYTPEELQEDIQNTELALQKLQEVSQKLETLLDGIEAQDIEKFTQNAEIDSTEHTNWYRLPSSHKFIHGRSIDELLEWCRTSGTPFFQNQDYSQHVSLSKMAEKHSGGLVRFESSYQPELPDEYRDNDLSTPEARRRCLERKRLRDAQLGIEEAKKPIYNNLVRALEGNAVSDLDNFELPTFFSEQLREPLREKFEQRYQNILGSEAAKKVAKFVSERVLFSMSTGYDSSELDQLIENLNPAEMQLIVEHFPFPTVHIDSSAGQRFQIETGVGQKIDQIELFCALWEYQVRNKALSKMKETGEKLASPEQRLTHLTEILKISAQETIFLYQQEIVNLVQEVQITNFEDLRRLIAPVLNLITDSFSRRNFLDVIVKTFDSKLPPQDILQFLEGEEKDKIWNYFYSVWKTERKEQLSPEEQLSVLETLFTIVPKWDKDCLPNRLELEYGEVSTQAPLQALSLSAEYIRLYREVNPSASFVEAFGQIAEKGFFGLSTPQEEAPDKTKPVPYLFLGEKELHSDFSALSFEDLKEVLLLLQKPRKKHDFESDFENKFVSNCIERTLKHFDVSVLDSKEASLEDVLNIFDEVKDFCQKYIPAKNRDTYLERFLKKLLRVPEFSPYYESDVIPELQKLGREDILACFEPISEKSSYSTDSILSLIPLDGLKKAADKYDPSNPGLDTVFKKNYYYSLRLRYIDRHLHKYIDKRHILREKGLSPLERIEAIVKLIPERTDYKDNLFGEVEEGALEELNLTTEGHRIVPQEGSGITKEQAQSLYYFYVRAIPEIVNTANQQMWSRRADQLFEEYIQDKNGLDFASEFERIKSLYPDASYARDEALMRLGNSSLIIKPDQARKILDALFVVQRRTTTEKESQQQGYIEKLNPLLDALSRDEKQDFLLWIIGANKEPPLTFRAFGGENTCSVEDVPKMIFAVTASERKELFVRILNGKNGILNAEEGKEQVLESFFENLFEKIFPPSDSMNEKTRTILLTTFKSIMNNYSEFRRASILISLVEILKGQKEEASVGERIHTLMGELGPVAIKVEQVLCEEEKSPGEYLLPEDIRTAMQKSKQDAKTFHRTAAFQVLESAGEFDPENPHYIVALEKQLAAASIKQVLLGRRADGTVVIEKIRRPSIGKHLEEDLRVLQAILNELSPIADIPEGLGERIARWLEEEADFEKEVESHLMLQRALEHYPNSRFINFMPIRTAEIYASSKERIQEEWVQGLSLGELMALAEDPAQMEKMAKKHNLSEAEQKTFLELTTKLEDIKLQAFDVMMYLMFKRGEFHSDLHGGNILITPKGELTLIDAGSTGKIEPTKLIPLKKFFTGFLFNNPEFVEEGVRTFVPTVADTQIHAVMDIIQDARMEPKEKFKQILQRISENKTHIDPGFEKFIKGLATGSYLSRGIDPVKLAGPIMTHASPF